MNNNIVYVKTENGIFKCYKSEQMNKPIYYPVNNSGFINYNDVEKILTIDDFFEENQKLKSTLELYKGSLHREHEAIHRANDLEEENQELKNQQKEFINFLNNMIIAYKRAEKEYGNVADRAFWIAFETALSKYKEIIGDKYE